MKNIYLNIIVLGLAGFLAMQSCTKDNSPTPVLYKAAVPSAPSPHDTAVIPFSGTPITVDLKWAGTATNAITWDVHFGTSPNPPKVATATSNTYSAQITTGGTYYWQLITIDANNVKTTGPIWSFEVNSNPGTPTLAFPASNALNQPMTPKFKWLTAIDPEGDALTYDIYLDTLSNPKLTFSGVTDTTFQDTLLLLPNKVYNWKVVAKDPYRGTSESPIWTFTTGTKLLFAGQYNVDEPAESYSYPVAFSRTKYTTITDSSYWNSGWIINFTLNFDKLTYGFPRTSIAAGGHTYYMIESGVIDNSTGTMVGTYTIWEDGTENKNVIEQGTHTYTMSKKK